MNIYAAGLDPTNVCEDHTGMIDDACELCVRGKGHVTFQGCGIIGWTSMLIGFTLLFHFLCVTQKLTSLCMHIPRR
jgi:hypothetical protein